MQNGHYGAIAEIDRLAIEPEKIKRWREDQTKMLEEKGLYGNFMWESQTGT